VLDLALKVGDAHTTLRVVLWLATTLKKSVLAELIEPRARASKIWAAFLRGAGRFSEAEEFFILVRAAEVTRLKDGLAARRATDATLERAITLVARALAMGNPASQLEAIQRAALFTSSAPKGTIWDASPIEQFMQACEEWAQVLRRQVQVEKADAPLCNRSGPSTALTAMGKEQEALKVVFQQHPRRNIIGVPVLELMHYLALYHPQAKEEESASPKGLRKAINMSERLYWHAAFTSLAKLGAWAIIRSATQNKSMMNFSGKTDRSPIGWRPLFDIACDNGAASQNPDGTFGNPDARAAALHFAAKMEDRVEALRLCITQCLWDGAVLAIVDLKDARRLATLRKRFEGPQAFTPDRERALMLIDEAAADPKIEWSAGAGGESNSSKSVFGSKRLAGLGSAFKKGLFG